MNTGIRQVQNEDRSTPCWCSELEHLRNKARRAFNKASNSILDVDWDAYKVHRKEYEKVRTKTKKA